MMDSFARQVFDSAKQQLRTASVTSATLLLFFMAFHLLSFSSFVQVKAQLMEIDQQLASQTATAKVLDESMSGLKQASDRAAARLDDLMATLMQRMISQMQSLGHALHSTEPPSLGQVFQSQQQFQPQQQQQQQVQQPFQPQYQIEDPHLLQLLADKDTAGLTRYLPEYERQQIINPAFASADQQWQNEIKPHYLVSLDSTIKALQQLKPGAAAIGEDLALIIKQVQAQRHRLNEYQISPPEQGRWWASVQGKSARVDSMEQRIAAQLKSANGLSEGRKKIDGIIKRSQASKQALMAQKAQLEKQFQGQQQQLQSLGSGFAVFAVDLESLSLFFPAILGLLIGLSLHWIAHHMRQLLISVDMLLAEQIQLPSLSIWLAQIGFWVASDTRRQSLLADEPQALSTAKNYLARQSMILAVGFCLWILLAGYQSSQVQAWEHVLISVSIALLLVLSGIFSVNKARVALLQAVPKTLC